MRRIFFGGNQGPADPELSGESGTADEGGVSPASRKGAVLLSVLVGAALCASAIEPDGDTSLRYEWAGESAPGQDGRTLRVSMTARGPIAGAVVGFEAPKGIQLQAVQVIASDGTSRLPSPEKPSAAGKLSLGDVPEGGTVLLAFVVRTKDAAGGILSFRIEGTARDGREVREGVGIPFGRVGSEPVIRDGVAEFPAATPERAP
jgi:hypothetical protein